MAYKPFLKIKLSGAQIHNSHAYLEGIEDYFDEVVECVEEKIPKVLKEMVEMAAAAASLVANVADEFGDLSVFEKAKAVAKCA
jgi:hypothetical protein